MSRKGFGKYCILMMMICLVGVAPAVGEEAAGYTLEEMVVIATRTPLDILDAPQRTEVIDRLELEAAGGLIDDALDKLPAVRVNRTGSGAMASLPTIRGSQPGEVLVLVNGHRLNSQQSGWFNLSDLPLSPSFIERIEVLEDSSSALYGAEAMGGVINIITRDPASMPSVALKAQSGSSATRGGELSFSRQVMGAGLSAFAGCLQTDGFRPNSDADRTQYGLHASVPGEAYVIDLWADVLSKEMGSPGPEQYPSPLARQWDDTAVYGLRYEYSRTEMFSLSADAFWNRYLREYDDPDFEQHSRHLTHTGGGALQGVLADVLPGRWTAGLEGIWDEVDSTNDGEHSLDRQGLFVQAEYPAAGKVTAVLTARYDWYSLFDDQFSPRAALVCRPFKAIALRGSAARGYRTPTFDDLFWDDPWAKGNPDLDPERSWNYELSLTWLPVTALQMDVNLFRRDVTDLIVWQDLDGDWTYSPDNITSARVDGAYAAFRGRPGRGVVLGVSYLYIYPEDRDRKAPIGGRQRNTVKADVHVPFTWVGVDASVSWLDRYPAPNLEDVNYWTTSVRLSRKINLGRLGNAGLSLSIQNVLDQEYQVVPGYPMPGRETTVEVSWEF